MRLNLKATNITLSDDIRSYLEKRLSNLGKLIDTDDPAVLIDVELGRTTKHHQSGDIFFAEINIHRGKEAFRAVSNRPDLNSAIDDMHDEIAGELLSWKGKKKSFSRRGAQIAKAILKRSYGSLEYLSRPAQAGWKYVRKLRFWRK
jgi:ribosomal subunit interface protein